jgi:hypothetical protein
MASVHLCASRACNVLFSAWWNSHLQTVEFVVIFPVELCCCATGVVGSFYELVRCLQGMVSGAILLLYHTLCQLHISCVVCEALSAVKGHQAAVFLEYRYFINFTLFTLNLEIWGWKAKLK